MPEAAAAFCPATPPTGTADCVPPGLLCEYGTNVNPECNALIECTSVGWNLDHPMPTQSSPFCSLAACPSTYADVPKGFCSPNGLNCGYADGECNCWSSDSTIFTWQCSTPEPGCPQPRARLGTECSTDELVCDYGPGGTSEQCQAGVWLVYAQPSYGVRPASR